jgi:hypothetical protein
VKAGRYRGKSAQGEPVSFTVSASRKTITGFTTFLDDGNCGQVGGPERPAGIAGGALEQVQHGLSPTPVQKFLRSEVVQLSILLVQRPNVERVSFSIHRQIADAP